MEFPGLGNASSHQFDVELSDVASSFVQDIRVVLAAASVISPALSARAGRAISALNLALRGAAGSPNDGRWSEAYSALADFIAADLRRSLNPRASASLARLSNFLDENADLAQREPQPFASSASFV